MNPILNKRCPKCGYLTLCECNNNIYCLCSNGCDYTDKKNKNNYDIKHIKQKTKETEQC